MLPERHTKRGIWLKQKGRNMARYEDSHNPLSPLVWGQAGKEKGILEDLRRGVGLRSGQLQTYPG